MRKEFFEPELRKVELNLKERIAGSLATGVLPGGWNTVQNGPEECTDSIVSTSYSWVSRENVIELINAGCYNYDQPLNVTAEMYGIELDSF